MTEKGTEPLERQLRSVGSPSEILENIPAKGESGQPHFEGGERNQTRASHAA